MEQVLGSFPLHVATIPSELQTSIPYPVQPLMTEPSVYTLVMPGAGGSRGIWPSGGRMIRAGGGAKGG